MYFFFDDSLVRTVSSTDVPKHAMYLIFDIYVNPWYAFITPMPPADFIIDEFNYYTLNTDCDSITISNPSADYYNAIPARAIEKTITTKTVSGVSPTFNLSDSCTLRATDYILLDEGTTINSIGPGQFSAIVMPCPN